MTGVRNPVEAHPVASGLLVSEGVGVSFISESLPQSQLPRPYHWLDPDNCGCKRHPMMRSAVTSYG